MLPFVAIDFETGHKTRDSAISLGMVRCEGGSIVEERHLLIRPPQGEVWFTRIHGLRWADVRDAPPFAGIWPEVAEMFEGVAFAAAHNAAFDRSVLRASCSGAGLVDPSMPFVCTVKMARRAWDLRPTRLPDVARHLGVPLQHHDALSDARVCAQAVLAAPDVADAMLGGR